MGWLLEEAAFVDSCGTSSLRVEVPTVLLGSVDSQRHVLADVAQLVPFKPLDEFGSRSRLLSEANHDLHGLICV